MKHNKSFDYPLGKNCTSKLTEEIIYRLNFLQDVTVELKKNYLKVFYADYAEEQKVYSTVQNIVDMSTGPQKKIKEKIIFESSTSQSLYQDNIYNELVENNEIASFEVGLSSFNQTLSFLMEYFDSKFLGLAHSFDALEHTYSTLMSVDILERCNYFDSFPQYTCFVSHIEEKPELYNTFSKDWQNRKKDSFEFANYFKKFKYVLSPAVCFHCYKFFENSTIETDKSKIVTAKGKCFRYESKNMRTLERLCDFTMREIIFISDRDFILAKRTQCIKYITKFIDELGLVGYIEVANDPFFTNTASEKKTYQLGFELKYEIRLQIPFENNTIAVGSFNFHEDFFGKTFHINMGKDIPASTGCTAFGIERWVYAFLAQYGLDRKNWPKKIIEFINKKKHKN